MGELMSGLAVVVVMMMMMMMTMMMTATITATIPLQLLHFLKRVSGSVASFPAPCSRIDSTGSQRLTTRNLYPCAVLFSIIHVSSHTKTRFIVIILRLSSSPPPRHSYRAPKDKSSTDGATADMFTTTNSKCIIIDHQPAACSGACVG